MARSPLNATAFDRAEYEKADQQFRLVSEKLPRQAVTSLAREVVNRLAFRMPRVGAKEELPSEAEIDALCDMLLSSDDTAADDLIVTWVPGGKGSGMGSVSICSTSKSTIVLHGGKICGWELTLVESERGRAVVAFRQGIVKHDSFCMVVPADSDSI